jgi:hypothetical protein
MLAARRVATATAPTAEPSIRLPADPHQIIAADPGFARVDVLRRVGLAEFALLELEEVVQRSVGDPVRLYAVSSAYVKEERYHLALRILRRHLSGLTTTGHPAVPRAFWEMVYPFGWRSEVSEAAEHAGLDPFFVAAVVREESSYYPRAVSRAGARGLMQLMPATARRTAKRFGVDFDVNKLLSDAAYNAKIGAAHLGELMDDWKGSYILTFASYNAGGGNVKKWIDAYGDPRSPQVDPIDWVERIPFSETRNYVQRVMENLQVYRRRLSERSVLLIDSDLRGKRAVQ